MKLDKVEVGKMYKICALGAKDKLLQKLLDMGFVTGAKLEVLREAPMSDPIEIKIHNYLITLRKSEASLIEVKPCN